MSEPLVSVLFLNCNRLKFLKNAVYSFLECNKYPNIEILICDNGSTEPGTGEWLDSLTHPWVKHKIRMNDPTRIAAAKNRSRALTHGEYILDVHEDFQFICKGDWMLDLIDVANSTPRPVSVFYYATVKSKLESYELKPAVTAQGTEYFRVLNAGYHDVHFMRRDIAETIGPFAEDIGARWHLFGRSLAAPTNGKAMGVRTRLATTMVFLVARIFGRRSIKSCESEYIQRAAQFGFGPGTRTLLKYPIAAPLTFPNLARFRNGKLVGYYPDCDNGPFYYAVIPYSDIKMKFAQRELPPTIEEVCQVVGIADYSAPVSQRLHYG